MEKSDMNFLGCAVRQSLKSGPPVSGILAQANNSLTIAAPAEACSEEFPLHARGK